MGGLTFEKGNKDRAIQLSHVGTYEQMIYFVRNMNAILYNTQHQYAQLVDGVNTLLYLAYTQLLAELYYSTYLFKLEEFTHALSDASGKTGNVAQAVLTSPHNIKLRLDEDSITYITTRIVNGKKQEEQITETHIWCFKDLAKQTQHSLEQIYEHQMKVLDAPAMGIRLMDRDQLEGFGFMSYTTSKRECNGSSNQQISQQ